MQKRVWGRLQVVLGRKVFSQEPFRLSARVLGQDGLEDFFPAVFRVGQVADDVVQVVGAVAEMACRGTVEPAVYQQVL